MKQFADTIPIAIFAAVYFYTRDIFVSTAVLMACMCALIGYEYGTTRTVKKQNLFIFVTVVLLGGLTLAFRDEAFIQWKPTLVNWGFSIVLLGSLVIGKVNLLKKMLGEQLSLPDFVWKNLSLGWSLAFFIAGALNLIVAFNFSMDIWVSYKLIGGIGLTLIYMIIMMAYLVKGGYLKEAKADTKPTDH